jgi:NADH-quinone oxidoreductase subunit M
MPGLPGTSGFIGEFFVILASLQANFWIARTGRNDSDSRRGVHTVAGQARAVRRGRANEGVASMKDVDAREFWMLAVLGALVLLLGIWPAPLIEVMDVTLTELLAHVLQSKL